MNLRIHQLHASRVHEALHTRPEGLRADEVAERLRQIGPNELERPARFVALRSLARQLLNFFTLLLFAAALLCFVAHRSSPGESMDVLGYALVAVALLNALVGFVQEHRAERAMAALRGYLPHSAVVRREGRELTVPLESLVPGDVLLLSEGERIPADARLVEALYAVERMEELLTDPQILGTHVRAEAGVNALEGVGIAEAPRGVLIHHYKVDEQGAMTWANLIVATGHNNMAINKSIEQVSKAFIDGSRLTEGMLNRVQAVVRAYDPCLSCSTHAAGAPELRVQVVAPDGSILDEAER